MKDRTFDALADETRRRLLLALLDESERPVDVFASTSEDGVFAEANARLRVALYHRHLPKLHDCGYIHWDGQSWEVARGPNFAEVESLLECIEAQPDD